VHQTSLSGLQTISQGAKTAFGGDQAVDAPFRYRTDPITTRRVCVQASLNTSELAPVKMMFLHAVHGFQVTGDAAELARSAARGLAVVRTCLQRVQRFSRTGQRFGDLLGVVGDSAAVRTVQGGQRANRTLL
jgi:hypothetical protein